MNSIESAFAATRGTPGNAGVLRAAEMLNLRRRTTLAVQDLSAALARLAGDDAADPLLLRHARMMLDDLAEHLGAPVRASTTKAASGPSDFADLFPASFDPYREEESTGWQPRGTETDRRLVVKAAARERLVDALFREPPEPPERRPWRGRGYR